MVICGSKNTQGRDCRILGSRSYIGTERHCVEAVKSEKLRWYRHILRKEKQW